MGIWGLGLGSGGGAAGAMSGYMKLLKQHKEQAKGPDEEEKACKQKQKEECSQSPLNNLYKQFTILKI